MYSTKVNGETLEFGTSGLLYRSNKLMYDRGTQTLWQQFLGEPVVGPLADSGIKLQVLPVVVTTWDEWLVAHPDTTVLDVNTGIFPPELYRLERDPSSSYYLYRASPDTMFPVWRQSDLLPTKAQVLGLNVNGQAKAYPLELLSEEPVLNDSLGGTELVVVTIVGAGAARAYERGTRLFFSTSPGDDEEGAIILRDDQGRRWRMEEEALVQEEDLSRRLPRVPSHMSYWFGWYAFYPATDVYGETGRLP